MTAPDPVCERARCLASLRLDGETTEFEEAFLGSHLEQCPACEAYSAAVAASTVAIRATPLVDDVDLPATVIRQPRMPLRHVGVAAAAVVVFGAALSGLAGLPQTTQEAKAPTVQRPAYLDSVTYELRFIQPVSNAPARANRGPRIAN